MAKILDGKKVAENLKFDLLQKFQNEEQLKFIIVHHNDEASSSYLKGRKKIREVLQSKYMILLLIKIYHNKNSSNTYNNGIKILQFMESWLIALFLLDLMKI